MTIKLTPSIRFANTSILNCDFYFSDLSLLERQQILLELLKGNSLICESTEIAGTIFRAIKSFFVDSDKVCSVIVKQNECVISLLEMPSVTDIGKDLEKWEWFYDNERSINKLLTKLNPTIPLSVVRTANGTYKTIERQFSKGRSL